LITSDRADDPTYAITTSGNTIGRRVTPQGTRPRQQSLPAWRNGA